MKNIMFAILSFIGSLVVLIGGTALFGFFCDLLKYTYDWPLALSTPCFVLMILSLIAAVFAAFSLFGFACCLLSGQSELEE